MRLSDTITSGKRHARNGGALYTSVRLDEDWLREAVYLIAFTVLVLIGAGKFSVDHLLKRKKPQELNGSSTG